MSIFKTFTGSIKRITLGLYLIQLFKAILSFFTVIVSSAYFGASIDRDVWLLSLSIMTIIGLLLFGPVFEIFRSKFTIIKEKEGEHKAMQTAGSLLSYLSIISIIVILIIEFLPEIVTSIFSPDYSVANKDFLVLMVRLFIPTIIFTAITSILTGILNVYNMFYLPEFISIASTLLNMIIIVIFADRMGIYSLVISNYVTNLLMLTTILYQLFKNKIPLFQNLNLKFQLAIPYFKFALPFYFNYLVAQILLTFERIITTYLAIGSLSVLDYARKFVAIPISMIQGTINSVLTTTLASTNIKSGEKAFIVEVNKFLNTAIIVTLPLIVLTTICPKEIVTLFLFRGKFEVSYIEPTSKALFWFGIGIVSVIFYSTCAQALVAKGANKTSAFISGTMGFLILAINLLLYKKYGVQILAFSWSIIHLASGILMYFALGFKNRKYLFYELIHKLTLLLSVILLSKVLYSILEYQFNIKNFDENFIMISMIFITSVIFEIILLYLFKFEEKEFIKKYLFRVKTLN